MMRALTVLGLTLGMLLAAPAAWAMDWGGDVFSVDLHQIAAAEAAMGTTFESYAIYADLDSPQVLLGDKAVQARQEGALIYLNINSRSRESGNIVPICYSAVATGENDDMLHAWAQAILSMDYSNLIITFNHEPMLNSPNQPKCSHTLDNGWTYRHAFSHVEHLIRADGVTAPWAYVMTWAATKYSAGLTYRPTPRFFQMIGTDQYFGCNFASYAPPDAFRSFYAWTAKYAPTKPVLVGEVGALTTCPIHSLEWLAAAKSRMLAHNDVMAINWNLREDEAHEYSPLLQPDMAAWWLDWASEETGD